MARRDLTSNHKFLSHLMEGRGLARICAFDAVSKSDPDAAEVPPGLHAATKRQRQASRAGMMRTRERFMGFISFMA